MVILIHLIPPYGVNGQITESGIMVVSVWIVLVKGKSWSLVCNDTDGHKVHITTIGCSIQLEQ